MRGLRILTSRVTGAIAIGALGAAIFFGTGDGVAQSTYPDRTIRILTVNPAGGASDIVARVLGDQLTAAWGKSVVVEAVVGAGGSLAAAQVARAAPDGYTLLMSGDAALVTNISLYEKLAYDPVKDLTPISQVVGTPNILVVSNDVPAKTVAELVALAKSKPGELTFAHGGVGFSTHLAGEMFKVMAKVDVQTVAYRTSSMPDLLAGRITMCFCNIAEVLPLVRDNRLRALAVTSPKRWPTVPELATMDELGFPGFDITSWFALMAPAGTPQPIIEQLHQEVVRILARPEIRNRLAELGMGVIGNSPAELAAVIKTQTPQREKIIKASGVKLLQ